MAWEKLNNRARNRRQWGDDPQVMVTKTGLIVNEAFVVLFDVKHLLNVVVDRKNKRLGFFHPKHDSDRLNAYRVTDDRRMNTARIPQLFGEYMEKPYHAVLNKETGMIEVDFKDGLSSPTHTASTV